MVVLIIMTVVAIVAYKSGIASRNLPRHNNNMIHWVCASCGMEVTVNSTKTLRAVAEAHNEFGDCSVVWTPNTLPRSLTGK